MTSSDYDDIPEPATIETILSEQTSHVERFLTSEFSLPLWEPPPNWSGPLTRSDEELERATALNMLRMSGSRSRYYFPDMLLYLLGELEVLDPEFSARFSDFRGGNEHIFLCNASGTGKTRMLFETLAQDWGLYLTCAFSAAADPYGSPDLQEALFNIPSAPIQGEMLEMVLDVSSPTTPEAQFYIQRNRAIGARYFRRIILSRLLMLDHFCALVKKHKIDDSVARLKWLLLQLRPGDILKFDDFRQLYGVVDRLSDQELVDRITALVEVHGSKLKFVAVDEAQVALKLWPRAFTRNDDRQHAPIFVELIAVLGSLLPSARLIAAGTEYVPDLMLEAVCRSGSDKRGVRFLHELGCFRTKERVQSYISHFLGAETASTYSSLVFMWLRGRHRLLALWVTSTLMAGIEHLKATLDTIVYEMTKYRLFDLPLVEKIRTDTAIDDKRFEAFSHPELLRGAVSAFVNRGEQFSTSTAVHELVYLGVALYQDHDESVTGEIFEPMLLLSICNWLNRSPRFSAHAWIRRHLEDDALPAREREPWGLRGLAACLVPLLNSDRFVTLHSFLTFAGLLLPRIDRKSQLKNFKWAEPLVQFARDADDVLRWFKHAERPFLIPDPAFEPDMVFFVQVSDMVILVCIYQPEPRTSRHFNQHVPLAPGLYYRKSQGWVSLYAGY